MHRRLWCAALACLLSACSGPAYYLQAASGQWKLLRSRQDIQRLLEDPATRPQLAGQLRGAQAVKSFAEEVLGLPADGSYSSYVEVDGDALVWNVVAAGEFSLRPKRWCFPVAGCVPYRGFFQPRKAEKAAARLRRQGMDAAVWPAAGYSTLGWFEDPLPSTLLAGGDTRLAAYLFHELAHQRLYVRGDSVFNEGYASFVEETGVRMWLESGQRRDELRQWRQLQSAAGDFDALVRDLRGQLDALYRSSRPEARKRTLKAQLFQSFADAHAQLVSEKWQGRRFFSEWFEEPPNNATLALYDTYESSRCAFLSLLAEAGGNLPAFHRLAEQKAGLRKQDRSSWLRQPCPGPGDAGEAGRGGLFRSAP